MKLYFRNSQGKLRVIAEPTSEKECSASIKQFLDEHGFKSYYTRTWKDANGNKWHDVGSHTEFFISTDKELDEDDCRE